MNSEDVNIIIEEYDSLWYVADFWPGEYPPRFSIVKEHVLLEAREEMRLTAWKSVDCSVAKLATYSPWNTVRNEADGVRYRTVSKISTVTITDNVSVLATDTTQDDNHTDVTLNLGKGDELQFLIYHAEGFGLYLYQGSFLIISESDFDGKAQFEENAKEDDLWLELSTTRGGRGWVLFSDAIATEGVVETDIEGWGIANDLPDPASLSLKGVAFVSGSADLTDASKLLLEELSDKLRQVREVIFEIGGHTDSQGSAESNQKLSYSRASAVADYLVDELNIDYSILRVKGYGEAHPIADNNTAEGRAANRRVELKII